MTTTNYLFYLGLLAIAGTGEYFHLVPMGTLAALLGGVLGHGISEVSRQQKGTPPS